MTTCALSDRPDVELYFYDELDPAARAVVAAHLRDCAPCRQRLDDLLAIRRALAAERVVEAPPAGDWSGFMRRLDAAVGVTPASTGGTWRVRQVAALAAMLALVATGVFIAARLRTVKPAVAGAHTDAMRADRSAGTAPTASSIASELTPVAALREISAEHLERSKLVVLGLTTRNPQTTTASDWSYERQLAGTLLADTRLYRLAAQERGVSDVAHVMRDLETVLLEASMSDASDRDSLERVQHLIARRGLVSQMQVVTSAAGL